MDDIHFLHGKHVARCVASVDKHFTYHTLQLMTRGGVELFYDGRRFEMRGKWMWPCYPGPLIRFWEWPRGSAWNHRYVAFSGPLVSRWRVAGLLMDSPEAVSDEQLGELVLQFDDLLAQMNRAGRWGRLRATNVLERILLQRCELRHAGSPEQPEWLAGVLDRLGRERAVADYAKIAQSCGMSLTTFRRQFRVATGCAVHEYSMLCRVGAARSLLVESGLPLKQVAREAGYSDVYYFSRHFKKATGVSPGEYRRSVQR